MVRTRSKAKEAVIAEKASKNIEILPQQDGGESEGGGEVWDLSKIYTEDEIKSNRPTRCQTRNCRNTACSEWVFKNNGRFWNSCLDCQEKDFDGWPDDDKIARRLNDSLLQVIERNCRRVLKSKNNKASSKTATAKVSKSPSQSLSSKSSSGPTDVPTKSQIGRAHV